MESTADDDEAVVAGGSCEIGSLEMPPAEWLFSAAAAFQQGYGQVHPYLAAGLCIAGTLMNLVTVLVLTRPSMRSPVNVLLCAVACCDIVVESSYLVFVMHFLLASAQRCEPSDFSWAWAIFMMFHAHVSVIFHAASIWMTVSLAQIRVLSIRRATSGPTTPLITERFTVVLAVFTTLVMTLVNVPNFLTFEIMEVPASAMLPCWSPAIDEQSISFQTTPTLPTTPTKLMALSLENNSSISFAATNETTAVMPNQFGSAATAQRNATLEGGAEEEVVAMLGRLVANLTTTTPGTSTTTTTVATPITSSTRNISFPMPVPRRHRLKRFRRDLGMGEGLQQWAAQEPMVYTVRAHESDCMKLKLAFWSNGMIFKVIPCLLLTLSIVALLRIIAEVSHKRKNLAQVMHKKVPKDHTTPMLAAILLIFLIAELPQGVFLVMNGIFSSESFHKRVYLPLGDLMDLLSLLNSAVGFLIYVGMSRKFRTVFLQLIFSALSCLLSKSPCLPLGIPSSSTGGDSTPAHDANGNGAGNGRSWYGRERSRASSGNNSHYQQLLSSGHQFGAQYSTAGEQPSCCGSAALLAVNGTNKGIGGSENGGKAKQKGTSGKGGGGKGEKDGWQKGGKGGGLHWTRPGLAWIRRWRRISTRTTTELLTTSNSRAEQLSLCFRNSITGAPPLTLTISCSAGITAAAASVGVHLLHLDELKHHQKDQHKPDAQLGRISQSPSAASFLPLAPQQTEQNLAFVLPECQRPSSQMSNGQYLDVPSRRPASSASCCHSTNLLVPKDPIGSGQVTARRATSFHSLCEQPTMCQEEEENEEEEEGQRQEGKPQKRISFNLPPVTAENEKEQRRTGRGKGRARKEGGHRRRDSGNGHRKGQQNGGGGIGLGSRLRRSFLLSLKKKQQELMLANDRVRLKAQEIAAEEEEEEVREGHGRGEGWRECGDSDGKDRRTSAASSVSSKNWHECRLTENCVQNCPGRALLKLQQQHEGGHSQGAIDGTERKERKLSSTLARVLGLSRNGNNNSNEKEPNPGSAERRDEHWAKE